MDIIKTEEELRHILKKHIADTCKTNQVSNNLRRSTSPEKLLSKSSDLKYRKVVVDVSKGPVDDLYNFKAKLYNEQVDEAYKDICYGYYIDENILRKNIEFFDGDIISETQNLSEEFIEEYQDVLNWYLILLYQDLSTEFLERHKDKITNNFEFQSLSSFEEENARAMKEEENMLVDIEDFPELDEDQNANPALAALVDQLREFTAEEGWNSRRRIEKQLKRRIVIYRMIMGLVAILISVSIYASIVNIDNHFSTKEKIEPTTETKIITPKKE